MKMSIISKNNPA